MKKQKKYSKFRVPKYPEGGFNPNTMLHSLNPGENPYSHDQLLKMGYQVGNSTGEYITPTGDYAFYKPQYPTMPMATTQSTNIPAKPKLAWPTRTDYSAGSVGPRYKQGFKNGGRVLPKYLIGGRKPDEPIASAADQQAINQQYETSMMDEDWGMDSPNNYQAPESNSMNAGQYAAAGTALAVGGANTYKTYQDPNATLGNKYDAMGNTATGVVSAINPLIGAGTAATYAVGRPVRNKLEEYDEQGNLKNKNAAQAGMLFNSFISDPLSSVVTNVSNGIWTPKQYTDRLEKDRKATLPQEQVAPYINPKDYRQDAVWQRQSGAYGNAGEFKMGGKMCYPDGGMMPNAELEKQEVMQFPNGSTDQVNGPTHKNGGVPVSIPAGTQIYSDRLKMPGTKKTFAKLAEKYKTNKEEKVLSDDKANSTAKKTAELIAQVKKQKLDELFTAQENLKQSKVQSYAKKLGVSLNGNEFAYGGRKLPKYYWGGPNGDQWIPDSNQAGPRATFDDGDPNAFADNTDMLNAASDFGKAPYIRGNATNDDTNELVLSTNTLRGYNPTLRENFSMETIPSNQFAANTTPALPETLNKYTPTQLPVNSNSNSSFDDKERTSRNYNEYIEPTVNTILQNSGNIWDLALTKFGTKYDKENYGKVDPRFVKPRTTDATEALRDADRIAAATRNNLKNVVGGNAGAYMANLTANQVNNTLNKARIREANQNTNTGILNQADAANAGIANQFAQYNKELNLRERSDTQQNKARSEDIARQAVRGVGTNTSSAYRDYKAEGQDRELGLMMSEAFKDPEFKKFYADFLAKRKKG